MKTPEKVVHPTPQPLPKIVKEKGKADTVPKEKPKPPVPQSEKIDKNPKDVKPPDKPKPPHEPKKEKDKEMPKPTDKPKPPSSAARISPVEMHYMTAAVQRVEGITWHPNRGYLRPTCLE